MGDALALALLKARDFSLEDLAAFHPAGFIGQRLLKHVSELHHTGAAIPLVKPETSVPEMLLEMTAKRLGVVLMVDADGKPSGVFTDGDLRRALDRVTDVRAVAVDALMTRNPVTVPPDLLAAEALALMEGRKINALLVTEPEGRLVGALNMHDLLRARVV